jgi:cytochrome c oxidase subunit II
MTSLLVVIVLVLLSIAVWQLTKIFNLSQIGNSNQDKSEVANDKDNNIQGYLMFGFLAFIYIFTIYGMYAWGHFVLSNPSSEHGLEIDRLMNITWVLIFTVQAITQVLLHYFAFKYRGKKENRATFFADSDRLEFIWTIIPAVVLAGLILYGLYAWTNIMFVDEKAEKVMVVELYAKQFGWEARYAGKDNVLGKANVRYVEGVNTTGMDLEDPYSQDDKTVTGEFHIPVGTKVLFKLRSQDVLHSAYMPHFRAQMNCVPGMVTQFAYKPIRTTADMRLLPEIQEKVQNINKIRSQKSAVLVAEGKTPLDPYTFDYLLLCNKICGASHYNMQMKLVVDTPQDFKDWLKKVPTLVSAYKESVAKPETDSTKVKTTAPVVALASK